MNPRYECQIVIIFKKGKHWQCTHFFKLLNSTTSHEICQKFYTAEFSGQKYYTLTGWQKLCEGKKGLCRKVWTWTKILSTRKFFAILRFVAIYTLFGRLGAKKCFLGKQHCSLGSDKSDLCQQPNFFLTNILFRAMLIVSGPFNSPQKCTYRLREKFGLQKLIVLPGLCQCAQC